LEEGAQQAAAAREIRFHDARRTLFSQLGNEHVLGLAVRFHFQRKHASPFGNVICSMKLHGIFVDTTTPFDHNGELYRVKIEHNIGKWNQTSVSGYVVGGYAGEGAMLSAEEKRELWRIAASSAATEKTLIAGVDNAGVHEASRMVNH